MQSRKHYIPALDFSKYTLCSYQALYNTLEGKPPRYVGDLSLLRGRRFQGKWFIERKSAIDYMKSQKKHWESKYVENRKKGLGHDAWIKERVEVIDALITILEYNEKKVIENEQWKEQTKKERECNELE